MASRVEVWRIGAKVVLGQLLGEHIEFMDAMSDVEMVRQFEGNHSIDFVVVDVDVVSKSCFDELVRLAKCGQMPTLIVLTEDEAQRSYWKMKMPSAQCVDKRSSAIDFADAVFSATCEFVNRRFGSAN